MNNNVAPGDVEGKCPHCKAELIFEKSDFQLDFVVCPTCSKQFAITKNKAVIKIIKDKIVIKLIKKYLPDFLILIGVYFLTKAVSGYLFGGSTGLSKYSNIEEKRNLLVGGIIATIGINVIIRKYISSRYNNK